jgi:hypothetical protein
MKRTRALDKLAEELSPELKERYYAQAAEAGDEEPDDETSFGDSVRGALTPEVPEGRSVAGETQRFRALMTGIQSAANKFGSVGGDGGPKSNLGDTMDRFNKADDADVAGRKEDLLDSPIDEATKAQLKSRLGPSAANLNFDRITYRHLNSSPLLKTAIGINPSYSIHSMVDDDGNEGLFAINQRDPNDRKRLGGVSRSSQTIEGPGGDRMERGPDLKWRFIMGPHRGKTLEEAYGPGAGSPAKPPTGGGAPPAPGAGGNIKDTDPTPRQGETTAQAKARAELAQAREKQEITQGVKKKEDLNQAKARAARKRDYKNQMMSLYRAAPFYLKGPYGGGWIAEKASSMGVSFDAAATELVVKTISSLTNYIKEMSGTATGVKEEERLKKVAPTPGSDEQDFEIKLQNMIDEADAIINERLREQGIEPHETGGQGSIYKGDPKKAPIGARMPDKNGVMRVKTANGWVQE